MKKFILSIILLASMGVAFSSCENMLKLKDEERLSGDDFWNDGDAADVEAFTLSMYSYFRMATMQNTGFLTVTGDWRCAPILPSSTSETFINQWSTNDVNGAYSNSPNNNTWAKGGLSDWKTFYQVIQTANILLAEIDNVEELTSQQLATYKNEAIFMRCLTYFFLVRAFGDVPYYTEAYNSDALPRTNMVVVLQNCLAELQGVLDSDPNAETLPWTYRDAGKKGIRAMRGGLLALMMHINTWLVRFDVANATAYYEEVVRLGDWVVNRNEGAYALVEMDLFSQIFRGGSDEGLFEISQNINYSSEVFLFNAVFSNNFVYNSIRQVNPRIYYDPEFLTRIYPPEEIDRRKGLWFDENMYLVGPKKEVLKFLSVDVYGDNKPTSNSGNQIVFRLADVILLYAEALAQLGGAANETAAIELLSRVRDRAGAVTDSSLTGKALSDAIYWERVRELMGEGHYYYDLVRTGKLYNREYTDRAISRTWFNAGAWTLPIHSNAFLNNIKMTHNAFWL
jgi:hypothetical protein